jgi:hypothetical protein
MESIQIGPFHIYYLLKDENQKIWNSMLEYIDLFYDTTCRGKISREYKKSFKEANLMVVCMSQDIETYKIHKIDLLNGFLIAKYDEKKKDANIILVCFQDIYERGIRIKISGGLFLHCLALSVLRNMGMKNVYLEASDEDLIQYYYDIGYRLGKSPCGKRDKITDLHKTNDIKQVIEKLPSDYANEDYDFAYRMKWCNFREESMCFKVLEMFRKNIYRVREDLLKNSYENIDDMIGDKIMFIGPPGARSKYRVIEIVSDDNDSKKYYAMDKGDNLFMISILPKIQSKDKIECMIKAIQYCEDISCFVDTFEMDVKHVAVVMTLKEGYVSLEDYLLERYQTEIMDGDKITKNLSKVLNKLYLLKLIPKISEKNIYISPDTLDIYIPEITCGGDEKKNTKFIKDVYDTIQKFNESKK